MTPSTFSDVAVVGMHFRGSEIKELVASFIPPVTLRLEREQTNAYDEYAIKVFYNEEHIGYIEAIQACFLAPWMDEGHEYSCTVDSMQARKNNLHPICTISPNVQR